MKKIILSTALCTIAFLAGAAYAVPVKAPQITASENDVKLATTTATVFAPLGKVNTQGKESSTAFAGAYAGDWSAIGAFGSDGKVADAYGLVTAPLSFTFAFSNSAKTGTWSVTNTLKDTDITTDLVFSMHTGGGSGAWLFDNHVFLAGTTQDGTWVQRMLNNGDKAGDFSNLTLFTSGMKLSPKVPTSGGSETGGTTDVPEPATAGTMLLALGILGLMLRRRKQS